MLSQKSDKGNFQECPKCHSAIGVGFYSLKDGSTGVRQEPLNITTCDEDGHVFETTDEQRFQYQTGAYATRTYETA
tara:strand:+ start:160 stop:387 length:228 start_codon:yes stop_codon:yes gene_type:complete